jgi:hypothetical protein
MIFKHGLAGLTHKAAAGGNPNLMPNDDFQAADWGAPPTGWTISGGVVSVDGTQVAFSNIGSANLAARPPVEVSTAYEVSITCSALPVDGRFRVQCRDYLVDAVVGSVVTVIDMNTIGSTGTYTGTHTTTTGVDNTRVVIESTATGTEATFDAISFKLI